MWFTFLQVRRGRTFVVGIRGESTVGTLQDTLCGVRVHPDFPLGDEPGVGARPG
jgi:hypothetical protein